MTKVELTMGERFKDARLEKNQHGKQQINEVSAATSVSASLISDLENDKDRRVNYKDIATLADYYGVSLDYLINGSPLYSKDIRINSVANYTGLSIKAVELLHLAAVSEEAESKRTLRFLNMVLADPGNNAEKSAKEGEPITTAFSMMDRFVHSKSAKLSELYQYNEKPISEESRSAVVMDLDDEPFMFTAPELIRQFLMNQIQKSLERYQEKADNEKNKGKQ